MPVSADLHRWQIPAIVLKITIVLFIISLLSPAVSDQEIYVLDRVCLAPRWSLGWRFFLLGPLGVLDGQFGWLANPLMLLAALTKRPMGLIFATLSVALAVHTAFSLTHFPKDGGLDDVVCGFGPGYYLWVACSVLVLVATSLRRAC
jgi:hypothetical protein